MRSETAYHDRYGISTWYVNDSLIGIIAHLRGFHHGTLLFLH